MGYGFVLAQSPPSDMPVPQDVGRAPESVQLVIPPELVDKLAPHDPGMLTQPVATLIAAGVALIVAGAAWFSVKRQIASAANNVQRQLDVQADHFRLAQEAQAAKDVRTERLNVLRDVLVAASRVFSATTELRGQVKLVIAGMPPAGLVPKAQAVSDSLVTLATEVQLMEALGVSDMHDQWTKLHLAASDCVGALRNQDNAGQAERYESIDEYFDAWAESHRDFLSVATRVLDRA